MTYILTVSLYLWQTSLPVVYPVPVEECTKAVMEQWADVYKPSSGYKAIHLSCGESVGVDYGN